MKKERIDVKIVVMEAVSMEIITLKNDKLTVEVSTLGAQLQSVECGGREYLWHGDPDVWQGRAPLLFPICGGLKDDKYTVGGKKYSLQKHGFARFKEFAPESVSESAATFLLTADSETREMFPFEFELRVTYTLDGASVKVGYDVKNTSADTMYFSIGAHEGYACPEGIEEYHLEFEKKERLTTNELHGNLLSDSVTVLGEDTDVLPLKYDYFSIDALTFLNLKSRSISLVKNDGTRRLRVDFDGFDNTFVWTKPGAKYLCIEPWCGLPDFEGTGYEIENKRAIEKAVPGESFSRVHTFTVEK